MKRERKPRQVRDGKDLEQKSDKGTDPRPSGGEAGPEVYIPYLQAKKLLEDRLEAAEEDIAIWCWIGPEEGGLAAYLDPHIYNPPIKFTDCVRQGADYCAPLMTCWFRLRDINKFQPADRYLSSPKLVERWSKQPGLRPDAFITGLIEDDQLFPLHPHGRTKWHGAENEFHKKWAIFSMSEIESIEEKNFPKDPPTVKNDMSAPRRGVAAERIIASYSFWNEKRWRNVLRKPPYWLEDARLHPIIRRKAAFWNPAELGNCLLAYRQKYAGGKSTDVRTKWARRIPYKAQLELIIRENFPEWLADWKPDLD